MYSYHSRLVVLVRARRSTEYLARLCLLGRCVRGPPARSLSLRPFTPSPAAAAAAGLEKKAARETPTARRRPSQGPASTAAVVAASGGGVRRAAPAPSIHGAPWAASLSIPQQGGLGLACNTTAGPRAPGAAPCGLGLDTPLPGSPWAVSAPVGIAPRRADTDADADAMRRRCHGETRLGGGQLTGAARPRSSWAVAMAGSCRRRVALPRLKGSLTHARTHALQSRRGRAGKGSRLQYREGGVERRERLTSTMETGSTHAGRRDGACLGASSRASRRRRRWTRVFSPQPPDWAR